MVFTSIFFPASCTTKKAKVRVPSLLISEVHVMAVVSSLNVCERQGIAERLLRLLYYSRI